MRAAWVFLVFSIPPLFCQSYPAPTTVFSNIFGGRSGADIATALAVDAAGNAAIIGTTGSPDFPVTNAYLPDVPTPPLIAVAQNGWTFPNLGPAVDVLAMASTKDGSIVYATSDSGIFRSADGGVSWTQQLPGLAGASSIAVDGGNPNTVYAAISDAINNARAGVFKSTDGGQNWTSITALRYLPFLFMATLECPAQIAGTIYATDNGFYRSRDAGNTWVTIGPNNNNVFSFALAASDPSVVYTVSSDGFVYRSADGGDSWTKPGGMFTAYPSANQGAFVYGLAVDPLHENTVWALELNGNLYKSTDGGATFSLALSDPAEQVAIFLAIDPSGQNIIVSSRGSSNNGGNAIVTYDGGASWSRVITPSLVNAVFAGKNSFFIESVTYSQGFLTKWSADGSRMMFSTFLPGAPTAVASDAQGNTYVAGQTVQKFDSSGDLLFTRSLGNLTANAMTVDSMGNLVIAASVTNGQSGLCGVPQGTAPSILKFDPLFNPIFSKSVPQACGTPYSMALDTSGAIYLVGNTYSQNLPTTPTALQRTSSSTASFLAVLSPQADQVTYLSYLQGAAGLAVDNSGNVYLAGTTTTSFPFKPTSTFPCGTGTASSAYVRSAYPRQRPCGLPKSAEDACTPPALRRSP
jgi:photosystem II stability/assembly factor-like uncharacterized protein